MENYSRKYVEHLFFTKEKIEIFIPVLECINNYEDLIIELLDSVEAYLNPLMDGLHKNDLLEFLTIDQFKDKGIIDFLRFRRYVTSEEDIKAIFVSYCDKENTDKKYFDGYKLTISGELILNIEERELLISNFIHNINLENFEMKDCKEVKVEKVNYSSDRKAFL